MSKLLLVLLLAFNLNAGVVWSATKTVAKTGMVYGAKKALETINKKAIHKNSKNYKGESHVYKIKNKDGTFKIGESSQGINKYGLSKRAEQQVSKLKKEKRDSSFNSEIIKKFNSKKEARDYETKLIERTRQYYGKNKDDKSILIGNKINR